jgi:hypothetical protein
VRGRQAVGARTTRGWWVCPGGPVSFTLSFAGAASLGIAGSHGLRGSFRVPALDSEIRDPDVHAIAHAGVACGITPSSSDR